MKFSINSRNLSDWSGSILVLGILEGNVSEQLSVLGHQLNIEGLNKSIVEKEFLGKFNQVCAFDLIGTNIDKLVLIGVGEYKDISCNELRKATSLACKASLGYSGKIGISFPWGNLDPLKASYAVLEAFRLSIFKDLRFLSDPKPPQYPCEVELIGISQSAEQVINKIEPICSGVELARELVGAPPNSLTPEELANKAKEIGKEFNLETKILEQAECTEKGMGAFLAVAQGSDLKPKFIHLTYKPKGDIKKKLVMVGKGLTFDSGGYNLKVGASQIEMMKYDMGGSAAVIGAAKAIAQIRPPEVEVHFLVATCENMVNGSAVHPGDIVTASNGKTIEINNTDAEGRLTLADALVYACDLKPNAIVDLATLTGACVIALGDEIAGLWSNSDGLYQELKKSSETCGEFLWRMPLQKTYKDGLKSMLADIKNTGPRAGGSITAALFLNEFIKEGIEWAHIDIAGTCWADKDRDINPAGATGFGVRTLVNWACGIN